MAPAMEVAFTSDGTGQLWNSCAWDVKTGTTIAIFKGGISNTKSLTLVGDSYLISAQKEKPLLQVWSLNGKDQQQMKIVCPGKVSALAVSHDGHFCVAGIDEKFHLWHISGGKLLAVVAKHLQPITCLKFSKDNSYIFSAGEDGMVMVWCFGSLIEGSGNPLTSSNIEPVYTWSDHALRVGDICVGAGGTYSRVMTVSSDMTCKVYELVSGQMLVSFVLDVAATTGVFDQTEYNAFVGGVDGRVYQIQLTDPLSSPNVHFTDEEKMSMAFTGHTKQVTALSVSYDGTCLLSASYDTTARLWHISSMHCLRVFQHKGPVLNAFLALVPSALTSETPVKPKLPLSTTFQRARLADSDSKVRGTVNPVTNIPIRGSGSGLKSLDVEIGKIFKQDANNLSVCSKKDLLEEVEKLKTINYQLYNYSVQSIFSTLDT